MSIYYNTLMELVFTFLYTSANAEVYQGGHTTDKTHFARMYNQYEETDFNCNSSGLFPNVHDTSCETYFSCEKIHNGQFRKQLLKCANSTFCSITASCSSTDICPCNLVATSNEKNINLEYPCISPMVNFTCVVAGRFPNFRDVTCKTYFLCSDLHNGTFIKTKYKCINSVFDSKIGRCSIDYTICPCNSMSSSTEYSITTTQMIETTVSSSDCTTSQKDFECKSAGRFPDMSDTTCRRYFLCSKLGNGTYIKTGYECRFSVFNPLILRCATGYICPCTAATTEYSTTLYSTSIDNSGTSSPASSEGKETSIATTFSPNCIANFTDYKCTDEGRFPDLADLTCKTYFLCSKLHNNTIIKTRYRCPYISIFYPPLEQCSTIHSCACTVEVTKSTVSLSYPPTHASPPTPIEETTIASSSLSSTKIPDCDKLLDSFTCTVQGRFPDLTDFTCRTYFLCSHIHNGSFIQTRYRCPKGSLFYPLLEMCSVTYNCPCSTSSNTWFTATTTEIPDISTNKSTELTTVSIKTSTSSCDVILTDFQCLTQGRFADLSDATCRGYFLCTLLRNGTFLKTSYICLNSSFNPLTHRCSSSYICPCTTDSTTLDHSASSEGFTMASTPTTPYICAPSIANENNFKCSLVGRFPDYTDSFCKRYYLCSKLHNGTFVKTLYNCPSSSCIDSQSQRCTSQCKCPCIKDQTT